MSLKRRRLSPKGAFPLVPEEYGRNYYARYDYEGVDKAKAEEPPGRWGKAKAVCVSISVKPIPFVSWHGFNRCPRRHQRMPQDGVSTASGDVRGNGGQGGVAGGPGIRGHEDEDQRHAPRRASGAEGGGRWWRVP